MYHGNWCGPGWSNGSQQTSVRGTAPATDEFDETCRQHDFAYADNRHLRDADLLFARQNIGRGAKRTLAGAAVGIQGLLRPIDKQPPIVYHNQEKKKTMVKSHSQLLRGATPKQKPQTSSNMVMQPRTTKSSAASQTMGIITAPPVAYGTTMRAMKPTMTRSVDSASISGRDFISSVEGTGVATFGLGKSALLNPAYFQSTFLGNLARSYERYKWKKLRIHYVPKVATTQSGQVILCSQRSVTEPGLQPESGSFLNRAMSQGNAVFSPLWQACYIDIDTDSEWRLVDPATSSDLDDAIHEELQVYTQVATSGQVGYLFAEYIVEFKEPIYQPHSAQIPIPTGPGLRVTLQDAAAVNAILDDWNLVDTSATLNLSNTPNGTIFRAVFDITGSTLPGGATFSGMLQTTVRSQPTSTTLASSASFISLVGGTTFYLVVTGSSLEAYTTLEGAIAGVGTGAVFFRQVTAATVGSYSFDVAIVRHGIVTLAQPQ